KSMRFIFSLAAGLSSFAIVAPASYAKEEKPKPPAMPVSCTELAANPASGVVGAPGVKSVESHVQAASGPNVAYCQVNVLYGTNPDQNINIRIGLPLNSLD